jgi:hypothetical protein
MESQRRERDREDEELLTSRGEVLSRSTRHSDGLLFPVELEGDVRAVPPVKFGDLGGSKARALEDVGSVEGEYDVRRRWELCDLGEGGEV